MRTATLVAPVRTDRPDAVRPPTDRADRVRTRAPLSDGGRPIDNRPAGTRPRGASPVTPRVGGTHCGSPVGVRGRGPLVPVGWLATAAGFPAVRGDLARAGRLLTEREGRR